MYFVSVLNFFLLKKLIGFDQNLTSPRNAKEGSRGKSYYPILQIWILRFKGLLLSYTVIVTTSNTITNLSPLSHSALRQMDASQKGKSQPQLKKRPCVKCFLLKQWFPEWSVCVCKRPQPEDKQESGFLLVHHEALMMSPFLFQYLLSKKELVSNLEFVLILAPNHRIAVNQYL